MALVRRRAERHRDRQIGARAEAGDKRFADPTWKNEPAAQRTAQGLSRMGRSGRTISSDKTSLSDVDKERAHLFTTILVDALAPTNSLHRQSCGDRASSSIPAAKACGSGLKNYLEDLVKNGGMPSQVDTIRLQGRREPRDHARRGGVPQRAASSSSNMRRRRPKVWKRPLVMTPPQINKYYAMDLSPDKSMVQFLLESGIQTFCVSWRNPTARHRDWGLDTYVAALDEAVDAVRDITGSDDISMMGSCSGGITSDCLSCDAWRRRGKDQESGARGLPARHRHGRRTAPSAR